VTVSFAAWEEGNVASTVHEIAVVAPPRGLKLEPISSRLKRKLVHSNRKGNLHGLSYSPDGKRIVSADYPGGTVQIWDTESGRQLTKIEGGQGYRTTPDFFFISPDWKTLYTLPKEKRKSTIVEKDRQRWYRWEFDGSPRAWDVSTGELRATYQHSPLRGAYAIDLSPDGATLFSAENLTGESSQARPRRAASLWDVRTGQSRPLAQDFSMAPSFSRDSKRLAVRFYDEKLMTQGIKLFDVATGKEEASIFLAEKDASIGLTAFSPDSKLLLGQVRATKDGRHWLKFWDAATAEELGSIEGDKNDFFFSMAFSPKGEMLAIGNRQGPQNRLFLVDVAAKRIKSTIVLGKKGLVRKPAFSPDGRRIAVISQQIDILVPFPEPRADDSLQARVHLIDVATGEVRETLVLPQGFPTSACFSPDGQTLATTGQGEVLLWDMTRPLPQAIP
jgi:WD40 repeat protein